MADIALRHQLAMNNKRKIDDDNGRDSSELNKHLRAVASQQSAANVSSLAVVAAAAAAAAAEESDSEMELIGVTTRKSKACPACRKQKIKCIMPSDAEGGGPPCKRCKERGLLCSPNKTLQAIVQEQAKWNTKNLKLIKRLFLAVNEARSAMSLEPVTADELGEDGTILNLGSSVTSAVAQSSTTAYNSASTAAAIKSDEFEEDVDITIPTPESVASAPIQSLYEITRIQRPSILADDSTIVDISLSGIVEKNDFISRGVVSSVEAERFGSLYLKRLDHYFFGHLAKKYSTLSGLRKSSTMLSLCVVTVGALHDPTGSEAYEKLIRELKSLTASLMFRPRLGPEDVRGICIGAYWLSDLGWMLSGLAIRKAISLYYHKDHLSLSGENDTHDAFVHSQLWLFTFLCNEQISVLQGVPPSGVTRDFVQWQQHMASQFASDADRRCVSHIDLLFILSRVRELYGLDTTRPIPEMLIPQLREFNTQVDRWASRWAGKLAVNDILGNFPGEAVRVHYHFAKFYVCSHAFRGLRTADYSDSDSPETYSSPSSLPGGSLLTPDLHELGVTAISTAFGILEALLDSQELQAGLVGVPHYFHTMYAFAAVFLLKVCTRYRQHIKVDRSRVFSTIDRVITVFSSSSCARQHLVLRIVRGLREMLARCKKIEPGASGINTPVLAVDGRAVNVGNLLALSEAVGEIPLDLENFDFLSAMPPSWPSDFNL
ncbi:uncharacterized protein V2V93DRAFT_377892 [Kockiozyma suomiensis]|uniref:uncharacterized protein n=1 Tax=Kockiozyma suomiensis TaxID=1337062 RepID=UPI0033436AA3